MKRSVLLIAAVLSLTAMPASSADLDSHPREDTAAARVIYVTAFDADSVLRFDTLTGAFLGVFVSPGSGGLNGPTGLTFGPDGHLYVASFSLTSSVLKYDGASGAFLGEFVAQNSGGLQGPVGLAFSPDGDLYVASSYEGGVFRYDGQTGRVRHQVHQRA